MKFFERRRLMVHINGGKLKLEPKTESKRWSLNLQVTLDVKNINSCNDAIVSNWQQIEARQNGIDEIKLGIQIPEQIVEFFGLQDHTAPTLRLGKTSISDLRMVHDDVTILEFKAEAECSRAIHDFVRDYAFTSLWAEFAPMQPPLPLPSIIAIYPDAEKDRIQ